MLSKQMFDKTFNLPAELNTNVSDILIRIMNSEFSLLRRRSIHATLCVLIHSFIALEAISYVSSICEVNTFYIFFPLRV